MATLPRSYGWALAPVILAVSLARPARADAPPATDPKANVEWVACAKPRTFPDIRSCVTRNLEAIKKAGWAMFLECAYGADTLAVITASSCAVESPQGYSNDNPRVIAEVGPFQFGTRYINSSDSSTTLEILKLKNLPEGWLGGEMDLAHLSERDTPITNTANSCVSCHKAATGDSKGTYVFAGKALFTYVNLLPANNDPVAFAKIAGASCGYATASDAVETPVSLTPSPAADPPVATADLLPADPGTLACPVAGGGTGLDDTFGDEAQ